MHLDGEVKRRIGARIQRARKDLGLTQERFAEQAEVSTTYVGRIERGLQCPSMPTLFRIAGALGKSPLELLLDTWEASPAHEIRDLIVQMVYRLAAK